MANAVVTTTSLQALAYCRRRRAPLQQQAADTILLQLKARGGQGTRLHGSTTYCHFVNSHQSEHKVCPAQPYKKIFDSSSLFFIILGPHFDDVARFISHFLLVAGLVLGGC